MEADGLLARLPDEKDQRTVRVYLTGEGRSLNTRVFEGMLKVAAFLGYKDLILGAFGCGAFGNDARIVSDIFYKVLKEFDYDGMKEGDMFSSIIFAVMDHSENQYNYKEFCRNFTNFYRDEDKAEKNHIIEKKNEREIQPKLFFWKDNEENGYLSNWYRRKFIIDDFEYLHVEQYMMGTEGKAVPRFNKIYSNPQGINTMGVQGPWKTGDAI